MARFSRSLSLSIASLLLLGTGCLEEGFGATPFEPVDEDFDRVRPKMMPPGAIRATCDAEPAPEDDAFGTALCLCGNLDLVGSGVVSRSSSGLLGADHGFGHIGINGSLESVGGFEVDGSLDLAHGFNSVGDITVAGDLFTGDGVDLVGSGEIGQDAWIDGDLSVVGDAAIGGDLYLSGDLSAVGDVTYGVGHRGFAYGGPPCGCDPGQLLDVDAIVSAHAADNDNALLPEVVGSTALTLTEGDYYFGSSSELVGSASIEVQGAVAVYIDGDIDSVGELNITIAEGGELELWVTGSIHSVGNVNLGPQTAASPRTFRLFMGGSGDGVSTVGDARFVGAIYAPEVDIDFVGGLEVVGSLFANNLDGTGDLVLTYDTDLNAPRECVTPLM